MSIPSIAAEPRREVAVQVHLVGANRAHPGEDPLTPARARRGAAEPAPEIGEVLDRRDRARGALEVARARLEAVARRPDLVRRQAVEDLAPPVHRPEVRPEELVGRAGDEVGIDGAGVERQVGRRVDRVDVDPRADAMRPLARSPAIGLIVPTAFEAQPTATSFVRSLSTASRSSRLKRAVGEIRLPRADDHLVVARRGDPGIDVRLVVEPAHDDLVAGSHRGDDRAREVERQRGHVRPEGELVGVDAEEVGERRVGVVDDGIGPLARSGRRRRGWRSISR